MQKTQKQGMLSVVLPAYNEEKSIARAAQTLHTVLKDAGIHYELIFVDDGSKDGTWEQIQEQHRINSCVRGVCFSRNFGKDKHSTRRAYA